MSPHVIDSFLPRELYDRLCAFIEAQPMVFGAKSNSRSDPHGHWSWKPFTDSRHNLADISEELSNIYPVTMPELRETWRFIKGKSDWPAAKDFKLIRCYANGYGYGEDGYFHTDSDRDGEHTIILYICDTWDRDWAGETVALDGSTYYSYLPHPNRCLILPSVLPHAARAVSRKCVKLRRTLMFKTRVSRSDTFEKLSSFLVSFGAHKIDHAKGSLHDHLMRVYERLEPVDPDVALGGGLHSIYGTNAFKRKLLEPASSNRAMVATMFGGYAENLAYCFSLVDRPRVLENCASFQDDPPAWGPGRVFTDMTTYKGGEPLDAKLVHDLCLIEGANLKDQDQLDRWPNLSRFWSKAKAWAISGRTPSST